MTGVYAMHIKLVSYGNEYITSGDFSPHNISDYNIRFVIGKVENRKVLAVENPNAWFKWLKDKGCKKLKLGSKPGDSKYIEDYHMVDYKDSGFWYMEAVYDGYSDYWVSKWEVTKLGVSWNVTYRRINLDVMNNYLCSFDYIKKEFLSAIDGVIKFAVKIDSPSWIKTFENAANEIDSQAPSFDEHNRDLLIRKNYTLEATQVIAAAARAWVFGGMGNWSDNCYGGELDEEHRRVTKALFDAVCKALICGVNSFPS